MQPRSALSIAGLDYECHHPVWIGGIHASPLINTDTVPELSAMFLILATLVGLSRVYLGVHYPTDVAAGGLIGYTAFCAVSHWIF